MPRPNRSKLQRAIKRRDKQRRNWCRRCPFSVPSGQCLDTTIRSGRCGDWVFYLLPGGKQCRRRWVRPKDPRTPAQVRNRTRLAAASRKYSAGLTAQELDACIAAGARRRSRARLGQSGPLTGQQYSVRREYAANAGGKVQNTEIPAKVPKPRRVTRPTWGLRRGSTGLPPEQHRRGRRVTGRRPGARGASEVPEQQRVTRSAVERYRRAPRVAPVQLRRGTGSVRVLRARLMQRIGVRPLPARRPTPQPCAAPARAPGARFDGGSLCRRR